MTERVLKYTGGFTNDCTGFQGRCRTFWVWISVRNKSLHYSLGVLEDVEKKNHFPSPVLLYQKAIMCEYLPMAHTHSLKFSWRSMFKSYPYWKFLWKYIKHPVSLKRKLLGHISNTDSDSPKCPASALKACTIIRETPCIVVANGREWKSHSIDTPTRYGVIVSVARNLKYQNSI